MRQNTEHAQLQVKEESFLVKLLLVTAELISTLNDQSTFGGSSPSNLAISLSDYVLATKTRLLYTLLASEKQKANAALYVLASIAKRGSSFVSELCNSFDFDLPALHKLARAPR